MNPNPLSVFRLIVPVIDAIRATSPLCSCQSSAPMSITRFDAEIPAHQGGNQAGPDGAPSQAGVSIAATHVLLRRALFDAGGLSQRWGHVDRSRTRMLLGDVRREAVRRDLLAAEPAEGLAGRDLDALHCITSMGDCRLDVKRESPWRRLGAAATQGPTPETVSSQ
jgi:hypothetical protein